MKYQYYTAIRYKMLPALAFAAACCGTAIWLEQAKSPTPQPNVIKLRIILGGCVKYTADFKNCLIYDSRLAGKKMDLCWLQPKNRSQHGRLFPANRDGSCRSQPNNLPSGKFGDWIDGTNFIINQYLEEAVK